MRFRLIEQMRQKIGKKGSLGYEIVVTHNKADNADVRLKRSVESTSTSAHRNHQCSKNISSCSWLMAALLFSEKVTTAAVDFRARIGGTRRGVTTHRPGMHSAFARRTSLKLSCCIALGGVPVHLTLVSCHQRLCEIVYELSLGRNDWSRLMSASHMHVRFC